MNTPRNNRGSSRGSLVERAYEFAHRLYPPEFREKYSREIIDFQRRHFQNIFEYGGIDAIGVTLNNFVGSNYFKQKFF